MIDFGLRKVEEVKRIGYWSPICHSRSCHYRLECAQHISAGQYREEGGESPAIEVDCVISNGQEYFQASCPEKLGNWIGMISIQPDGSIRYYDPFEDMDKYFHTARWK